jgi:cation:H+ antiporter
MAIGNIIGSNLCNLLLILGLSTIIKPIKFQRETRIIEIPMCLFITIIFLIICNTGLEITRFEAIILIVMFILFIYTQ